MMDHRIVPRVFWTTAVVAGRDSAHAEVSAATRGSPRVAASPEILTSAPADAVLFGPFCLILAQRILLKSGEPVRIGSRALELLIALVERPGEIIRKNELMDRVWPSINVVEANLTVQVAQLRQVLDDGRRGNRYIVNIPGRGYCFVSSVTRQPMARHLGEQSADRDPPAAATPLIGWGDVAATLTASSLSGSDA